MYKSNPQDAEIRKSFGIRLKKIAKAKGWKYADVGNKINISASAVSDVFNGRYFPTLKTVFKLSDCFGLDYMELLKGVEKHIYPKGYKPSDNPNDLIDMYKYRLLVNEEYEKYKKEKQDFDRISYDELTIDIPKRNDLKDIPIYDNSMDAIGIRKGLFVTYKEWDGHVKSGDIYVMYIPKRNDTYIRRVWMYGEEVTKVILIPCSTSPNVPIMEHYIEDIEFLGTIHSIKHEL